MDMRNIFFNSLHYTLSCFFHDLTKTQAQIYQVSKTDIEMTSNEALALFDIVIF